MNFSEIKLNLQEIDIEKCEVFHYKNNENFIINIFFFVADEETIEDNWKRFSNAIAAKFQNSEYMSENKEFEKWNFYIIYVSKGKLSKELKNKIENDRFSSRKIVEDGYSEVFNHEVANKLIVKHITNTDLKDIIDQTHDKIRENYEPLNTELWNLIHNNVSLSRERDLQKEIVEQLIKKENEN